MPAGVTMRGGSILAEPPPPPQPLRVPRQRRTPAAKAMGHDKRRGVLSGRRVQTTKAAKKSNEASAAVSARTATKGAAGRGNHGASAALAAPEVVTVTVKPATDPLMTERLPGVVHVAPVGAPAQAKVSMPLKPAPGIACRLY